MSVWRWIRSVLQRSRPAERWAEAPRGAWWTNEDDADGVAVQAVEYMPDDEGDTASVCTAVVRLVFKDGTMRELAVMCDRGNDADALRSAGEQLDEVARHIGIGIRLGVVPAEAWRVGRHQALWRTVRRAAVAAARAKRHQGNGTGQGPHPPTVNDRRGER